MKSSNQSISNPNNTASSGDMIKHENKMKKPTSQNRNSKFDVNAVNAVPYPPDVTTKKSKREFRKVLTWLKHNKVEVEPPANIRQSEHWDAAKVVAQHQLEQSQQDMIELYNMFAQLPKEKNTDGGLPDQSEAKGDAATPEPPPVDAKEVKSCGKPGSLPLLTILLFLIPSLLAAPLWAGVRNTTNFPTAQEAGEKQGYGQPAVVSTPSTGSVVTRPANSGADRVETVVRVVLPGQSLMHVNVVRHALNHAGLRGVRQIGGDTRQRSEVNHLAAETSVVDWFADLLGRTLVPADSSVNCRLRVVAKDGKVVDRRPSIRHLKNNKMTSMSVQMDKGLEPTLNVGAMNTIAPTSNIEEVDEMNDDSMPWGMFEDMEDRDLYSDDLHRLAEWVRGETHLLEQDEEIVHAVVVRDRAFCVILKEWHSMMNSGFNLRLSGVWMEQDGSASSYDIVRLPALTAAGSDTAGRLSFQLATEHLMPLAKRLAELHGEQRDLALGVGTEVNS